MDFDWSFFDEAWGASKRQIEESFEDPFALRLMPDAHRFEEKNRFFSLGRDNTGGLWLVVYAANGKSMRVVSARPMTVEEQGFYERKLRENL